MRRTPTSFQTWRMSLGTTAHWRSTGVLFATVCCVLPTVCEGELELSELEDEFGDDRVLEEYRCVLCVQNGCA